MYARRLAWTGLFLALLLLASPAQAAVDFDTLADQINAANRHGSGSITLRRSIPLEGPLPPISGEIVIEGADLWLSGRERYRIFDVVAGGSLRLSNLTLQYGSAVGELGGAVRLQSGAALLAHNVTFQRNQAYIGGAIATAPGSRLELESAIFDGNSASGYGGAIMANGGQLKVAASSFVKNIAKQSGGAIEAGSGSVELVNSTFDSNEAAMGGALSASGAATRVSHATMSNNLAWGGGGGIFISGGALKLYNSVIQGRGVGPDCLGQLAQSSGNFISDGSCAARMQGNPRLASLTGVLHHRPPLQESPLINRADAAHCPAADQLGAERPLGAACDIGAVESKFGLLDPEILPPPPCTLHDNIIAANTDKPAGGCPAGNGHDLILLDRDIVLYADLPPITSQITIEGAGHSISGGGQFGIFAVDGGELALNNMTLKRALNSLTVGGALHLRNRAEASVTNVSFEENKASWGGAIAVRGNSRLKVQDSVFVLNAASGLGNPITTRDQTALITYAGGAIHISRGQAEIHNSSFASNSAGFSGGAIEVYPGRLNISNSSFLSNWARSSSGGAIYSRGATTLTHVTMLDNSAYRAGGIYVGSGTLRLRNSLVANSKGGDCIGSLNQNRGNFIGDGGCGPLLRGDPFMLGRADSPAYRAPSASSPVLRAGDPHFCLETDQRGQPRAQIGRCDIGAIELAPVLTQLANCSVTTMHKLNFRDAPAGGKIGLVPQNAAATAIARTQGWFNIKHEGATGWISANYVTTTGDCS